jgi:hypothetical protein
MTLTRDKSGAGKYFGLPQMFIIPTRCVETNLSVQFAASVLFTESLAEENFVPERVAGMKSFMLA